jgi:glyoxylase I family protein
MATITGVHHLALTVSDLERSVAWYRDHLGMDEVFAASDDSVSFKVLLHPGSGWLMGLREYAKGGSDRFDEFRTGLDHFAFQVADAGELRS